MLDDPHTPCLCALCMREIFIFGGGSKYTLCPRGFNHVDSFRIYEALMSGARVVQRAVVEGKHCCVWPTIEACCIRHLRILMLAFLGSVPVLPRDDYFAVLFGADHPLPRWR